jgi:predicted nucleotidyltransferase
MDKFLLEKIRELKRQIMPQHRLILFGSQARGDATPNSDWDLLVLLNHPTSSNDDYDYFGYPFLELGWDYGQCFSALVYTEAEWERRRPSPFRKNVEQDGIEIV